MKILILGAAGFIGNNLAISLSSDPNNELTLVDNYFRGKEDKNFLDTANKENCRFVNCDLTNPQSFNELHEDYDQIYFLASVVGVGFTNDFPKRVIELNTKIILNTLEWLNNIKSKPKILFTSTSECYASSIESLQGEIPTPENIPLSVRDISEPRFSYAITKMLGEAGIIHYCNDLGFDYSIIRYHNVYGPRMGFSHVIPQVVERFLKNENPFRVYGYNQTRSFNYISDAIQGTILAMNKQSNNKIFHIGSLEEISIQELVEFIGVLLEFNGYYEKSAAPSGSVNRRCPDITLAKQELGYDPLITWRDGVKLTVDWYVNYFNTNRHDSIKYS